MKYEIEADAENNNQEKITSYKGFDVNFQCRGYQYVIGETYEHNGEVETCISGFHACEYPLDVLSYYEPAKSKFAIVEQEGNLSRHLEDSKVASKKITIKAELNLADLINAAIDYTLSRVSHVDPKSPASNSGDHGAASNSGDYGAASNSGDYGEASNSGDYGAASNSGEYGAASNSGDHGAASNSGYRGAASNSGLRGAASNSGSRGAASNSGKYGVAASFGYEGKSKSDETGGIVCVYRNRKGELIHIRASMVGDNGIKPNTWYSLNENGDFIEVDE